MLKDGDGKDVIMMTKVIKIVGKVLYSEVVYSLSFVFHKLAGGWAD